MKTALVTSAVWLASTGAAFAFAKPPGWVGDKPTGVPEIDASAGLIAIALVAVGVAIYREIAKR